MTNNNSTPQHRMIRRVETKEDGRILIYYTFESSDDLNERKSRAADLDKQIPPKERGE